MVPQVILTWLKSHKRIAFEAILGLCTALSVFSGITLHNQNKKLSESLELAQNNIEAYQRMQSQQPDNTGGVIMMDMTNLKNSKDTVIIKLDSVRNENGIKADKVTTAATQTQTLDVTKSKETDGQVLVKNDSLFTDSIWYNDLTKVFYTITNDSIDISLDVRNEQYLYTYKNRVYKNNKKFLKRLFTLDFKKVDRYEYKIVNTNDLIKESDLRIIEQQ